MKIVNLLIFLFHLLLWAPVHICIRLRVEEAQNLHFRHVGNVAGTVAMAHVLMPVNTTQHNTLIDQLCSLPAQLIRKSDFNYSQRNALDDLITHCQNLRESLLERERIWFNTFNDRSRKSRRVEVETELCPAENPLDLSCKPKSRKTRQFIVGAIAVAGLVAGVSALFSQMQLHELSSKVKAEQEVNIRVLQEHETRVAINERSIILLNKTVVSMAAQVADLKNQVAADEMLNHIAYTLDTSFADTIRVIRGLNALASHRLSPDLIQVESMARELKILADNMQTEGYILGISRFDDIFRCETSHVIYDNDTMVVILHIPAFKVGTHLRLLEHVPVPMVVEKPQAGTGSGERTPKDGQTVTLTPAPQHNLIAVTPDDSAFKVFTRSQLRDCLELGGTYYCSNSNLYDKRFESSCIIGLYRRNEQIITDHCRWQPGQALDFGVQLEANKFLLYQQKLSDVKLVCGRDTEFSELAGLRQVYVPPGCRFFSASFIFDGQANFSLSVASFIEKNINITSLLDFSGLAPHGLEDVLAELHLVGSSEGLTIRSIKKRYSKLNMDTDWDFGTRTIIAVIAGLIGLFVIWRVVLCCRKEESRRKNGGQGFSLQFNQVLGRQQPAADPNLEAAAARVAQQHPLDDALLEVNPDAILPVSIPLSKKPLPKESPRVLSPEAQKIAALDPDKQADILHDEYQRKLAAEDRARSEYRQRLLDAENQED